MKTCTILATWLIGCGVCAANSIVFNTPTGGMVSDGAVNATATLTTSDGLLTIQLTDLFANPKSAGQLVSGIQFEMGPVLPGSPLLTNDTGQEISIAGGTATLENTVTAGWGFGSYQSGYLVCMICPNGMSQPPTAPPSHLIIGPGPYTNANGSIDGNGPHNPFLNQTVTFTITNPGITSASTISEVTFYFGTTFGSSVPGDPRSPVPEPAPTALLAAGSIVLFALRRKLGGAR